MTAGVTLDARLSAPAGAPRHWAAVHEVTTVTGIRFLVRVHRLLGRGAFRAAMAPTACWYLLRHPAARLASRRFLARAFAAAGTSRAPTFADSIRHVTTFAESIRDRVLLWGGDFDLRRVTMHGEATIRDDARAGRGGVLLVSHLGNIEVTRVLASRLPGVSMTVLVHTHHAEAFNAIRTALTPHDPVEFVQVTDVTVDTVLRLRERVDRGGFVVIAADRIPVAGEPRTATVDFLGAPAPFPVGPYVIAALLECPVHLAVCLAGDDGGYDVHFERFADRVVVPRARREAVLAECAARFATRLAHFCTRAPLQWFNFFDFWAQPATAAATPVTVPPVPAHAAR